MLIHPRKQLSNGQIPTPSLPNRTSDPSAVTAARALGLANGLINPVDINNSDGRSWSGSTDMSNDGAAAGHMPHSICEF
jgi:hypothetical protein